jgi:KaiC/GvpD/RAD55 family RecA-like ATPase
MANSRTPNLKEIPTIDQLQKHIKVRSKFVDKLDAHKKKSESRFDHKFIRTGIPGFDELVEHGIPKGSNILVAGGAGTGKTIFCLQMTYNAAIDGEKCLYLSFEEPESRLREHMEDFGWDWKTLEKKGLLKIVRKEPVSLASNVEAMTAKAKGELLIDINEVLDIIPKDFHPDRIVIDSISALSASFVNREEGYRIFMEQLFRYFESLKSTNFLVSETEQVPSKYSPTGVEEFLADGVIVLYIIKKGEIRVSALEILKIRGTKIIKKLVPFNIELKGIVVYTRDSIFEEL